jgi:hypothetical protein
MHIDYLYKNLNKIYWYEDLKYMIQLSGCFIYPYNFSGNQSVQIIEAPLYKCIIIPQYNYSTQKNNLIGSWHSRDRATKRHISLSLSLFPIIFHPFGSMTVHFPVRVIVH